MIYLDHAATTPPHPRVAAAVRRAMAESWANPSALYGAAGDARRALRRAREALSGLLNASPQELILTSGGSEGNSQALRLAEGRHAVVSAIEHASVLAAARQWCREVTLVPPDDRGVVRPEAVEAALRADTALVSVQLANNETGVVQPAAAIGALARRRGIPYHCDAVQAVGRVDVDVREMNIDLLTLSAHKFYGPRGVGAMYVRQGVSLPPLIPGGGQQFGLRGGTEDVPGACGLIEAIALLREDAQTERKRQRALLDAFLSRLTARIPGSFILGDGAPRLCGVAAVCLPGLLAEQAVADMDLMGFALSGGAACSMGSGQVSHVYRAMGLDEARARCVVRVSIGRGTDAGMLDNALEALCAVYARRVGGQ